MELTMCQFYSVKYLNISKLLFSLVFFVGMLPADNASALNLKQAERLAIQSDPSIESFKATSRSFVDESIADDTLPDPKLRLGAVNVPMDSFDLQQEQMTQLKVGIVQNFLRSNRNSHSIYLNLRKRWQVIHLVKS